jgi:hypothetical protein
MRGKITIKSVEALSARVAVSGKEETLRDASLAGFEARARPDGTKVAYVVRYRAGSGHAAPMRRVTIGKHGSPWTPEEARAEAKRLLALVAHGKDPARQRRRRPSPSSRSASSSSMPRPSARPRRRRNTAGYSIMSSCRRSGESGWSTSPGRMW